jgi:hypothetical protein
MENENAATVKSRKQGFLNGKFFAKRIFICVTTGFTAIRADTAQSASPSNRCELQQTVLGDENDFVLITEKSN